LGKEGGIKDVNFWVEMIFILISYNSPTTN
jgi:hypothetical protein